MKKKLITLGLLFLSLHPFAALAQSPTSLSLPALFSDHMVLQQQSEVAVWGYAEAASQVRLVGSWNLTDTVKVTTNDMGKWIAKVPTTRYGGPYTLQIIGNHNTIELKDILLGEVWLCSGQSNMEWCIQNGVENQQEEISNARHSQIRYFSLKKQASLYPQDDCAGTWEICSPDVMKRRSALAYFFARKVHRELNVPVGVVVSAWGGTAAEVWIPKEEMAKHPELDGHLCLEAKPWWPTKPSLLYNSMIYPLQPFSFKGILWYQGESNRFHPESYELLMQELITSWRKGFQQNLPFYIVQIAPYDYKATDNGPALVREAQEKVARKMNQVELVGTNDIGEFRNIHPSKKREVGERLANVALKKIYGKPMGEVNNPYYKSMQINRSKVILTFAQTGEGLHCSDKQIRGMFVAGADGRFVPAKARLKGNSVIVSSSAVKEPVAVRYCFDDATVGNLFNSAGLPLLPFRTDK